MINWFKRPQRTSRGSAPLLFLSFHWWSHSRHLGSLQSSLFDLILPSVKFRFPLSSSSSFPQFFLLSSRSSLCSRCLLRPSGALFRLIGSIHQRSLESRGFSRIQTHVQPSPSYSPGPQCQFSPLELDRLTSNNFISLLSRPGDSERRRWWTFNSLIYQNVTTSQPWSKLDCCRPLLSWRNSAASSAEVCASLSD